ncbi:MAG: PIN domain nuclease [Myxococcales bacterium]|nr:PIN domain nuclease [Myxococcales bacterium]
MWIASASEREDPAVRILVDTSVWVDFFNGHRSREADTLARCIEEREDIATCGVILAEFFQGIRRREDLRALEAYFREMPSLAPRDPDTYLAAAALFRNLRAKGVTVRSTIDCLIARLAEEHDTLILARDRDLAAILGSGLCRARPAHVL